MAALTDVDKLVDDLSDESYLQDVFADDASNRVISGGALARILARELGGNVTEHAGARRAWFCSRVRVTGRKPKQRRYLEVIVADDGTGLTSQLHSVVRSDPRAVIHREWNAVAATPEAASFLLDYAFDRFTSSKRSLNDLMHLPRAERAVVSSGLFWIWNLVATEGGVVDVRTAMAGTTYDFRRGGGLRHRKTKGTRIYAGSLVRIVLPLHESERARNEIGRTSGASDAVNFSYVWAGDLAESAGFPPSDLAAQAKLRIAELTFRESLFKRLRQLHGNANDNTVLVLDLCGIRPLWEKASAVPLAHFFIESNYTSVFGRSAVVLWNVPETSAVLFEQAVRFAATQFAHLERIRRAAVMVFDSGRAQVIANSPLIERALGQLRKEGEMPLDDLSRDLPADLVPSLRRTIHENQHLFSIDSNRVVQLRAWPDAVTAAVWRSGVHWLDAKLDSPPPVGVRFEYPNSVFRLPTLGEYARRFFHFRALLADREAQPRLAWLMAHAIHSAEKSQPQSRADVIVSVTRPSTDLAQEVATVYSRIFKRSLRVIAADTPEDLAKYQDKLSVETAIYLTTVISTGSTSGRVVRATPWIRTWIGTVACVDTRQNSDVLAQAQVAPGAWLPVRTECETGEVYSLAQRDAERIRASGLHGERIVAIDPVNVCPVAPVPAADGSSRLSREDDLWKYARDAADLMHVGHFEETDGHHFVYFVDTSALLRSAPRDSATTVLETVLKRALSAIGDADPNSIIILHPPASVSDHIGRELQRRSGAKYREVLYRDIFAGRSRFNPLGELSLPWKNATVVLLDDASNTGEALMGLIDTAVRNGPRKIIAWITLSRLPPHRQSLFTGVSALTHCNDVSIRFALSLDVPVFTAKTCPVCNLWQRVGRVRAVALLKGATERVRDALSQRLVPTTEQRTETYIFSALNPSRIARLRESIERSDFDGAALEFVERAILGATQDWRSASDIAFILCSEPELVNASVFTSHLLPMLAGCEDAIQDCAGHAVVAISGFAVILATRLTRLLGGDRVSELIKRFGIALLTRTNLTSAQLGDIVVLLLAYTKFDNEAGLSGRQSATIWSTAFDAAAASLTPRLSPISGLYLRALRSVTGVDELIEGDQDLAHQAESSALCERAEEVASTFWSHATETLKNWIDQMELGTPGKADFEQPLLSLAEAMTELQGLHAHFVHLDEIAVQRYKIMTGISRTWRTPTVGLAIDNLLDPVAKIVDAIDRSSDDEISPSIAQLQQRWSIVRDALDPAFTELFPEVRAVATRAWQRFEKLAGLPLRVATTPTWGIERTERAFVPEPVLWRFLAAAIQNLGTAAFYGLSQNALDRARAWLDVRKESDFGRAKIIVRVSDNGPSLRGGTLQGPTANGHGEALKAVSRMVSWFDGDLIEPARDPVTGNAYVELSIRKYK